MDQAKAQKTLMSLTEQQRDISGLPCEIVNQIGANIGGTHLTFRYILLTALLAKVIDPSIHMRSLQAGSELEGSYDARSLCHNVIVPFDKDVWNGRLGGSNEPFLNKPARYTSVGKDNPVRSGPDKVLLCRLFDVLEQLNSEKESVHILGCVP